MSRIVIIIADHNAERFRTGLVMACAQAAMGLAVQLFFQGDALELIRRPMHDPDAARQKAAGLPTLPELVEEAFQLGAGIAACQSSLALLNTGTEAFDERVSWTGMIGILSLPGLEDRLIVI